ncbi:hypothetical protein FB565_008268 [Actinoplanes lutulentus]|uniref:Putative phage baseplate assembly protein n=1 Tax=Actinoplanes lutulentus TaxID=1287878 RepID=A0A327Z7M5_9ACTN|nr:baseplate J/gp47 family protein [Actinoplanes lutulentus]MBB2948485.1 hypothetical protein [Actinoplanes lutulentus]RAK34483.1 putative phage baseplate assembly protein [Actinoplanes lutulentus]
MTDPTSAVTPALDDIAFDQLVERSRALIPRYAPDWTDHNLHDPGMTLIDLFAWIVDQQVYRAGFVGGRHQRAFAALLGSHPDGPAAATGMIWPDRRIAAARELAAGTAVTCPAHPDLGFVLDRDLFLPPVTITGAVLSTPAGPVVLPPPGPGSGALVLGSTLRLLFDGPLGSADRERHVALGFDLLAPPGEPPATTGRPWGPVRYAYRAGDPGPDFDADLDFDFVDAAVVHDGTGGLSRSGVVVLEIPRQAPAAGSRLRISIQHGLFPALPQIRDVRVNVLPLVQRAHLPRARFDQLGTGLPDQEIPFDATGLVPPPDRPHGPALEIDVDGERWHEQPGLTRSGPGDPHYVLRPGRIVFGNGVNGRRPAAGAQIAHTTLARTAGPAGNLRPGQRWTVPALDEDGAGYGRNRHALAGGRSTSAAAEVTGAARDAATRRAALLTDEDLAHAALSLPGMAVQRAHVLAGHDPRLPGVLVAGARTLVVVPHQEAGPAGPGADRWVAAIAARLEPRRVLGERLIVMRPVLIGADLRIRIVARPGTVAADVESAVEQALRDHLSPQRRALGRELTAAEVTAVAAAVPGVADVPLARIAPAGSGTSGPVPAPRHGLVTAAAISVTTGTAGG